MTEKKYQNNVELPSDFIQSIPKKFPPGWALLLVSGLCLVFSIFLGLVVFDVITLPFGYMEPGESNVSQELLPQQELTPTAVFEVVDEVEEERIDPVSAVEIEEVFYLDVDYSKQVYVNNQLEIVISVTSLKNGVPQSGEEITVEINEGIQLVDLQSGSLRQTADESGQAEFLVVVQSPENRQNGNRLGFTVRSPQTSKKGSIQILPAAVLYDQDLDGLSDEKELELSTNLQKVDSDNDHYSDFDEVYSLGTDPTSSNFFVISGDVVKLVSEANKTTIYGIFSYLTPVFFKQLSEATNYADIFADMQVKNEDIDIDENGQLVLREGAALFVDDYSYAGFEVLTATPVTVLSKIDESTSLVRISGLVKSTSTSPIIRPATQCFVEKLNAVTNDGSAVGAAGIAQGDQLTFKAWGDCGIGEWQYVLRDSFNEQSVDVQTSFGNAPGYVDIILDTTNLGEGEHNFSLFITNESYEGIQPVESDLLPIKINPAPEVVEEEPVEEETPEEETTEKPNGENMSEDESPSDLSGLPKAMIVNGCNVQTDDLTKALLFDIPISSSILLGDEQAARDDGTTYQIVFIDGYVVETMQNPPDSQLSSSANDASFFLGEPGDESLKATLGSDVKGYDYSVLDGESVLYGSDKYIKIRISGLLDVTCFEKQ